MWRGSLLMVLASVLVLGVGACQKKEEAPEATTEAPAGMVADTAAAAAVDTAAVQAPGGAGQ